MYSGADERTGAPRPPAVPVGELLDALDNAVTLPGGATVRDHVVHHPLQTVDERNFVPGRLGRHEPFSFDVRRPRRGAGERQDSSPTAPVVPRTTATPTSSTATSTSTSCPTLEHPVRAFVRRRLGADPPRRRGRSTTASRSSWAGSTAGPSATGCCTAALDGIAARRRGRGGATPRRRCRRPRSAGSTLEQVRGQVEPLLGAASERYLVEPATSVDVTIALADGRVVTGTVNGRAR